MTIPRIVKERHTIASGTLVFWYKISQQNSKWVTPNGGAKYTWGRFKFWSLKITGNSTNQQSTYKFLLAFHTNCVPILHGFWDIARYWSKIAILTYLTSIWRPRCGWYCLNFRHDFWPLKTRVPGVVSLILGLAIFVELQLVTDKETNRQTHDDSI